VPLLEAMYFHIPILARLDAAVPETLGNAGVLFSRLEYSVLAELIDVLIRDTALRRSSLPPRMPVWQIRAGACRGAFARHARGGRRGRPAGQRGLTCHASASDDSYPGFWGRRQQ